MEDKKIEDETKKEEPVADESGEGDKPKATSIVDKASEVAKRMENANERAEEILLKQEELAAKTMLGGHAEAGSEPKKPKEETPHEYRMRINKELAEGKKDFGN